MGLNNYSILKILAELIRDEKGDGRNTAERVGQTLVDIIKNTDTSLTDVTNVLNKTEVAVADAVEKAANAESMSQAARNISEAAMDEAEQAVATANEAAADARQAKTEASKAMVSATSAKTRAEQAVTAVETLREDVLGLSDSVEAVQGALDGKADYDDVEMVEDGLRELTKRVEGMAVLPFDIFAPSATGQPFEGLDDGQVAFISGSGLFARKTPAGPVYPGTYNEMRQGVEPVCARRDCLFRCGNSLYRYDGGQLLRFVDSGEAEADREAVRRDFIGVWDEIDSIKELLMATATNEVFDLLGRLGYDEKEIHDFIYFNLHGYCTVTMDELRLSVWRWEHREELEYPPQMFVSPQELTDAMVDEKVLNVDVLKYVNYMSVEVGDYAGCLHMGNYPFVREYHIKKGADLSTVWLRKDVAKYVPEMVYRLSGPIAEIEVQPNGTRIYNVVTDKDYLTAGMGFLSDREIDFDNATPAGFDKLRAIEDRAFYRSTLRNVVGEWTLEGTMCFYGSELSGCDITLKHMNSPDSPSLSGEFSFARICGTTLSMTGCFPAKQGGVMGSVDAIYNVGQANDLSVLHSDTQSDLVPELCVSLYGAPTVFDMPGLDAMSPNSASFGVWSDGDWFYKSRIQVNQFYYMPMRCFFRNVGKNRSMTYMPLHQMFNVSGDDALRNIELLMEHAASWHDRKASGYQTATVMMSRKALEMLTDEEKAVFTSKGYMLVEQI